MAIIKRRPLTPGQRFLELGRIVPEGKVLLIDDTFEDNFVKAGRNLERVSFCESSSLSAMELVGSDKIIVSRKGFDTVLARANKE